MKVSRILVLAAVAASATALTSVVLARGGDKQKPLSPQFDAAGMQRYMEIVKPDFHHDKLAEWIGKWDTEIRTGPPGAQTVNKGTAEFSWLFERRWLQQRTDGELTLGPQKYKLQGLGLLGYDRYKQKYVGSSCDTMTTNLLHFEGNFDRTDNVLILFGPMDEPMSGEHDKCVKYVWRLLDKDKMVFEVHDLPIGEEQTKVVEITYTRHKN